MRNWQSGMQESSKPKLQLPLLSDKIQSKMYFSSIFPSLSLSLVKPPTLHLHNLGKDSLELLTTILYHPFDVCTQCALLKDTIFHSHALPISFLPQIIQFLHYEYELVILYLLGFLRWKELNSFLILMHNNPLLSIHSIHSKLIIRLFFAEWMTEKTYISFQSGFQTSYENNVEREGLWLPRVVVTYSWLAMLSNYVN
jgi:hypothetical protein